jgi:Zn-dependent M28 family amino/carboxypeptidase
MLFSTRSLLVSSTLALAASSAAGQALTLTDPVAAGLAAARITPQYLGAATRFLSDDLLEGRGPASRGDTLARLYIAAEMESMGLTPGAADGSWEQPVELVSVTAAMPKEWSFTGSGGKTEAMTWWEDYIAGSGVQQATGAVRDAEVVFVGYGIEAPEYGWDDYKGADVKGKILLMLNNDPEDDPELFEGKRRLYYGRWTYKYESAARHGAAGAIIVHTDHSAGYPFQVVQTSWSGAQFELPAEGEPTVQVKGWLTFEASRRLAALGGKNLDQLIVQAQKKTFRPVPLGVRTSIEFTNSISKVRSANVLGLLRGSDPALADEVVVYTAHHDHLGIGKPDASGDAIYNGAIDNASGVSQVLGIARAFAALEPAPRRSVLFAFVAAEEQGLLGSKYYARHPTFPPGKIAVNINFDAGNKFGRTSDITYIGLGKSSLDVVVTAAAAMQGRKVVGDQFPDRGSFYRSDQFNFAKIGVPALYLDGGNEFIGKDPEFGRTQAEAYTAKDYHQPSDEWAPDWNYDGMVEDAKVGFYCGLSIATADAMPTWNQGDEFEAARKKALAAVEGGE